MKRLLFMIVGVLFLSSSFAYEGSNKKNKYTEDEYAIALEQSKLEKKLIFLDFHAKWCTPCQWMDKTTFQDKRVQTILHEKYITVKVDIDDFDGFDLKQQYDVQTLPTLIFLNSEGKMIERLNETIGTDKFLAMLKKQSANVQPIVQPSNVSPFKNKVVTANETHSSKRIELKTSKKADPAKIKINKPKVDRIQDSKERISKKNTPNNKIKKSYASKSVNKDVNETVKSHLTLQMGVYSTQSNADKKKKYLMSLSNQPITTNKELINGKSVFKVYLGEFHSMDAAKRYKYKLQRKHNISSIVK